MFFSEFHGENKEHELVSAIKKLYKGQENELPVTMKTIEVFSRAQLAMFIEDFRNDIGIDSNFETMSKRRTKSHIKRFKYKELLRKNPENVQIQLVNQIIAPKNDEKPGFSFQKKF